ncbi:hypothetical protein SAPIO_CDS10279 [Scedosporium apiospermum]|uniref:Rhodopsin domain-containing protein n=1 Tax=Pseudallescheria apiosperma TaxID=563466 RepID=A0A084FV24_PSEDA|nr:uncharacterized protein SAPIO_CDS10279 [Scedosporium apiospermum]KEZ38936.1 hypothetical protein SAPIO_CDS10279 [Scedosporium apiospermum]
MDTSTKAEIWSLASCSAVFLFTRLYSKRRNNGWHFDDLVLFMSWIAVVINVTLITIIENTRPRHGTPPIEIINRLALTGLFSLTFAVLSQAWSKTSFAVTLLYISEIQMKFFLWFAIISINISFGIGALLFWIDLYSGLMDLAFVSVSWKIITPLHLRRKEKIGALAAMSMGVLAAVAAFIKASKFPSLRLGSGGDAMQLGIWGVVEPAVTIMAASTPALRLQLRKITDPKVIEDSGDV